MTRRLFNLNIQIEKKIKYLNNLRGNSEWNSQILSSRDFITPIDLKNILNNCQWDSVLSWSKLFRYSGRDYTVRRAEPHFRAGLNILSDVMAKKYRTNSNFFYSCLNQRGLRWNIFYNQRCIAYNCISYTLESNFILSIVQNGHPVSKTPEYLQGTRQFISTYLFDKPLIREDLPIEFPVTTNHMIHMRRSPIQIQRSSQINKINIIVPISLGRLETIHRFLRIWNDLYKQDKNQRLILSFSGTTEEHRTDTSFLVWQSIRKLKNIIVKIPIKHCRIGVVARFNRLLYHHQLWCAI